MFALKELCYLVCCLKTFNQLNAAFEFKLLIEASFHTGVG